MPAADGNASTTCSADLATSAAHARDPLTIGGRACADEDAAKALSHRLDAIPDKTHETRRYPLGVYLGLAFGIVVGPLGAPDAYLEGVTTRHAMIARDAGPRAVLNALGRLAESYPGQIATARQDLGIAEGQLRDYEARRGRPFAHDAYLAELTSLRDQLKAGLSQATPEPGTPTVAELAERIRSLKAAHTIDAAPERTAPRRIAAEEPVTARIRRRAEAMPAALPPADPTPVEPAAVANHEEAPASAVAAKHTDSAPLPAEPPPLALVAGNGPPERFPPPPPRPAYRERVTRGKGKSDHQLSLF